MLSSGLDQTIIAHNKRDHWDSGDTPPAHKLSHMTSSLILLQIYV